MKGFRALAILSVQGHVTDFTGTPLMHFHLQRICARRAQVVFPFLPSDTKSGTNLLLDV